MFEIEFESPKTEPCDCCDNSATRLTRFVFKDGEPFGVYYVLFTHGHTEKIASAYISVGNWDEEATPEMRSAFPIYITQDGDDWAFEFVTSSDSKWGDIELLGPVPADDAADASPLKADALVVAELMMQEDKMLLAYFS